jgi:hypothetical protein
MVEREHFDATKAIDSMRFTPNSNLCENVDEVVARNLSK